MTRPAPHVSRLVPPGPTVRASDGATGTSGAGDTTLAMSVGGDPEALGRLLATVEPLRADSSATIVTDADAEVVRFLAVLAVLEERAEMPDYDLDDPTLKWRAKKGVKAVPNAPTIVTGPASPSAPPSARPSTPGGAA